MLCAPSKQQNNFSCFSNDAINIIVNAYNAKNTHNSIDPTLSRRELITILTNRFKDRCGNDQTCWLTHPIVSQVVTNDMRENTFIPKGPTDKQEWLSNIDILNVMKQYESMYTDFHFIGAEPADFLNLNRHSGSLMNWKDFEKSKKRKIGLILNTLPSNTSGEHWVAIYADLDKNLLYYFDSTGHKPFHSAKVFMTRLAYYMYTKKNQIDYKEFINSAKTLNLHEHIKPFWNSKEIQQEDGSCGLFSIYFILQCLKGVDLKELYKLNDDIMEDKRNIFFRP
jgi:hypothetical protein